MAELTSWCVDGTFGKAPLLEGMFICDGCSARVTVVIPFADLKWEAKDPKAGPLEAFTKATWDDDV